MAQANASSDLDRDAFLRAVAQVETGGNPRVVGSRGERGLYQFGRTTWTSYTTLSFSNAHNPGIAYVIATKHFDWLKARFQAAGRPATSAALAMAWNGGLSRTLSGKIPRSTRDYARRVANLVTVYQAAAAKAAPSPVVVALNTTTPAAVSRPTKSAIHFAIDEPMAESVSAPEVVPVGNSVGDVIFSLSRPADSTQRPRFIFATIGE